MSDTTETHPARRGPVAGIDSGEPTVAVRMHRRAWAALLLIAVGLVFYLPGINWGLPGIASWSQDTIAAQRTMGAVAGWPQQWRGRYPPLHYLILDAAYKPILQYWEHSTQCTIDPETGVTALQPPRAPKVGLLILVARCITVTMAIATGLGVWAATRRLTRDNVAAMLAAIALMIGAAFTYFAHLGNVDIPSMCWLAWSLYFYVRALDSSSWADCLWLGVFASLAVCTKDAVAGIYPGMAIVLLAVETQRRLSTQSRWRALVSALWQPRWLAGLVAFALPYLVINGVPFDPQGFVARMRYWIAPADDSVLAGEYRYPNQLALLLHTVRFAAGGVGWPLLAAMVAAVVYTLRRHLRVALMMLVPALSYYVIVIAQINFVYARFLFPPMAMLCILLGITLVSLVRRYDWPVELRWGIPCMILLLSVGYATAINLAMMTDSRYEAEAWFVENVKQPSSVGAFSKPQYLPRLTELGFATYAVNMTRESFEEPQPDYLVLTSYNYEDFNEEQTACMKELLSGRLGYQPVVTFKGRYLGTGSLWLSLAGWGAPVPGKISPTITILRRVEP